jgi:hypothetical protein
VVGIDESHGSACTTTWPGIGAPRAAPGTIFTYPGDGSTGVPPAERAAESPFVPGKFVGVPEGRVAGRELFVYEEQGECPLLLFCPQNAPEVQSVSLVGPRGPVETRAVGGETPELGGYLTGAIIMPVKPLEANASYTAEVTLDPYGELPVAHHRWSFRTGPSNAAVEGAGARARTHRRRPRRRITRLMLRPQRFAVATRGRGPSGGARVSYRDSTGGRVSFAVYRLRAPGQTGGRCGLPDNRRGRAKLCARATLIYRFRRHDRAGRNSFPLTGRYGRGRRLAPGAYRLVLVSPAGARASARFVVR